MIPSMIYGLWVTVDFNLKAIRRTRIHRQPLRWSALIWLRPKARLLENAPTTTELKFKEFFKRLRKNKITKSAWWMRTQDRKQLSGFELRSGCTSRILTTRKRGRILPEKMCLIQLSAKKKTRLFASRIPNKPRKAAIWFHVLTKPIEIMIAPQRLARGEDFWDQNKNQEKEWKSWQAYRSKKLGSAYSTEDYIGRDL